MGIRTAKISDWQAISGLLDELGYKNTRDFMEEKLVQLFENPDEKVLIYEEEGIAVGLLTLHFIPQLALRGDFARISYFAVGHMQRSKGIGKVLEEFAVKLAKRRQCDRVEVHCHERRTDAHSFYLRQGYHESPKYFMKILKENEREI